MKTRFAAISFIAALLALAGCTNPPTVKSIAGISIPQLDTNQFTGVWITGGNNKGVIATRIKDGVAGIVEAASLEAGKDEISLKKFIVNLRESPAGLLWSVDEKTMDEDAGKDKGEAKTSEEYLFGRLVIENDHLLIYLPDTGAIQELAERNLLKLGYAKNDKGEDAGAPILESLGKEQFDMLETNGVSPYLLFKPEPEFVFVRLSTKD